MRSDDEDGLGASDLFIKGWNAAIDAAIRILIREIDRTEASEQIRALKKTLDD